MLTGSTAYAQAQPDGAPQLANAVPEPAAPAAVVPWSGSIDLGGLHHALSSRFPTWNGEFARAVVHPAASNTLNLEFNHLEEFGDSGNLYVASDTADLGRNWVLAVGGQGSQGGFFLPRVRGDLDVQRKLLSQRNLVLSLGVSAINAKDVHRDRAAKLGVAYYFEAPWVLEAGATVNRSSPGHVVAPSGFLAATYGRDKMHYLSLRLGAGREAYQLIGRSVTLSDFASRSATGTWRQWLTHAWGFQLRADYYRNPTYHRIGGEAGLFWDF